jgi:hypothetical protein
MPRQLMVPKFKKASFILLALCATMICPCISATNTIDKSRYITIDEITSDMDAYCLTVYEGTTVERFPLKVISVIKNHQPKRDMILVIGTDERFLRTGAVRGCSGSPVYIDGRLAGALAMSFNNAIEPLYLATPIEYMLKVGTADIYTDTPSLSSIKPDFSEPLDLHQFDRQLSEVSERPVQSPLNSLLPILTSLPPSVCNDLRPQFQSLGFTPIASGITTVSSDTHPKADFQPGGVFTIPLCSGDISLSGVGTVTEVIDNKIYALGHHFLGYGSVDLPMAPGIVHTVISTRTSSFKLASPGITAGAIKFDEAMGVCGYIGEIPKTIPLQITVDRFNDPQKRTYNCQLVSNRIMTPSLLRTALVGAGQMYGALPPEHTVTYTSTITPHGCEPVHFQNVSSGQDLGEFITQAIAPVGLLMNNPFKPTDIAELEFRIQISPESSQADIWAVEISDSKVKPGQTIDISVTLKSFLSRKKQYKIEFNIPEDIRPGQYEIHIAGSNEYENFLRKTSPEKFLAHDLPTLLKSIKQIVTIKNNRIYITMRTPSSGLIILREQLPFLPQTKAMLINDNKRTLPLLPYNQWKEEQVPTEWVVSGERTMKITVEK